MFFVLSKVFWILAAPSHWLVLLVIATALCLLFKWHRAAKVFALAAVALVLVAWLAAGPLVRDWEDRYPRPPWPAHVDGILVLGSGFDSQLLRTRKAPQSNAGVYRLVEGLAAARRYPGARLVFSGGSGALGGAPFPEADTARYVFTELGRDPGQMILESRSRNTYENLLFSKAIVKPKPGEVWILVTSADHMPRAVGCFRHIGWSVVPDPVDYEAIRRLHISLAVGLGIVGEAAHEWLGLVAYRIVGWTDALFPAP